MTRLLPAMFTLLATPVLAACPMGPAALDAGVTVQFDGLQITYTREADGRIREVERYEEDGETWIYLSYDNGLMLESWMLDASGAPDAATRESYSYAFDSGAPEPVPGRRWEGTETSLVDGTFAQARIAWEFSPPKDVTIGNCRYQGMHMVETRMEEGGSTPWINQYMHLPELGMTLYLGGEDAGTEPFLETPRAIFAAN